jgi:hypothetical protein
MPSFRLICEAKWDSGFQEEQAAHQWRVAGPNDAPGAICRQLFIVKDREGVDFHFTHESIRAAELPEPIVQTWSGILRALSPATRTYGPLGRWASDVTKILNAFGEQVFEGFDHLFEPPAEESPCSMQSVIFFPPREFLWGSAPPAVIDKLIFFNATEPVPHQTEPHRP